MVADTVVQQNASNILRGLGRVYQGGDPHYNEAWFHDVAIAIREAITTYTIYFVEDHGLDGEAAIQQIAAIFRNHPEQYRERTVNLYLGVMELLRAGVSPVAMGAALRRANSAAWPKSPFGDDLVNYIMENYCTKHSTA